MPTGHFRLSPRYPLRLRVAVYRQFDHGPRDVEGSTENLGFGGAFVRADPPLPPGTRIVLALAAATTWDPLRVAGVVRWVRDERNGVPGGMGVAFDPLMPDQALALHRLFGAHGFEDD